jgi:hypothetical protein
MNVLKYTSVLALLLAGTTAMAGDEQAATEKPSFSASQSQMVTARVETINHETREVTLLRADGETISFTASDEARNLDQVAVGDIVVAQYVSSISIEVIANDGVQAGALGLTTLERTEKSTPLWTSIWKPTHSSWKGPTAPLKSSRRVIRKISEEQKSATWS